MIYNEFLTNKEKKILNFFITNTNQQGDVIASQINQAHIKRETSPYFHILRFEFRITPEYLFLPSESNSLFPTIYVEHQDGTVPTVFRFYVSKGIIRGFEVYNADSSMINFDKIYDGNIHDGDLGD